MTDMPARQPFRSIHRSAAHLRQHRRDIGNTPLVRVPRLCAEEGITADLLLKLEFFNPIASVKDRIGVAMIEALEAEGRLGPGSILVEPTSGNTGIGLAFVCAARGYRLILTMPELVSIERRKMLALLGAEVDADAAREGHEGCHRQGREILAEIPVLSRPTSSATRPTRRSTAKTTAEEIWVDTDGEVDVIVVRRRHRRHADRLRSGAEAAQAVPAMVAVEPAASPVLSGGQPAPHPIQGIGAGFVPEILDTSLIDEIVAGLQRGIARGPAVSPRLEGIPGGISSGAQVAAALTVAKRPEMAGNDRHDHPLFRRTLPVDGPVRGGLIAA